MARYKMILPVGRLQGIAHVFAALVVGAGWFGTVGLGAEELEPAVAIANRLGVHGGLCVLIDWHETEPAAQLARSGRFLVQMLQTDEQKATQFSSELARTGLYGAVTVRRADPLGQLPYAERLVNLLVFSPAAQQVAWKEIDRVLVPGGVLTAPAGALDRQRLEATGWEIILTGEDDRVEGGWIAARKPWPDGMDAWPHPRYGANGNAVSSDRLVGPPRRVRWVAAAVREISNMVNAEGRNYYGGVWARDAFNGLRLWQRELNPAPNAGGYGYQYTPASVQPVAAGRLIIVVSDGKTLALDGVTGEAVREFPQAGKPRELLAVDDRLLTFDGSSVRAFQLASGRLLWQYQAANPQLPVAESEYVCFLTGDARHGQKREITCLETSNGAVRWQASDFPWLAKVRRLTAHGDLLVCEVSTWTDEKEGNALHMLSAADGRQLWERSYVPGMQHVKQARALFIGEMLWVLENRKGVALDPRTGAVKGGCPAGFCHCFPPVATERYLLAGELELTDLATGQLDANRITKAACSRDFGWVPANGLIYVGPKHCVCWPMLRGYVAMAPDPQGEAAQHPLQPGNFLIERAAEASGLALRNGDDSPDDWPSYRRDGWRSGTTRAALPDRLRVQWEVSLGDRPEGMIAADWRENPFVAGPVSPPVVAGGLAYVARPDAHQLAALNVADGGIAWRFTANGRVDTPPTIHRGRCLFGTKTGWVYCLRADTGQLLWRLRAAPSDEQMIAYGQLESPWPVSGSLLVVDDVLYFAAGRQPLADGGILVFAADPASGSIHWVRRLDTLPMDNFYACVGLEFDNFDLLHREGDAVAMSRWLFDRSTGEMTCKAKEVFAVLHPHGKPVVVPRGCWSYAPRHLPRHAGEHFPKRPLAVYCDDALYGSLPDYRTVYCRRFTPEEVEKFDTTWITGWAAEENFRKKQGEVFRSDRLAPNAAWKQTVFDQGDPEQRIAAMVMAGDRLLVAGAQGGLVVLSADAGSIVSRGELPPVVWDGVAVAAGRVFAATTDGRLLCLGE